MFFASENNVKEVFIKNIICILYNHVSAATASMKLFRTVANSACRSSTHHLRRNSSFRRISLSPSPTRSRSSLSSVPATPWSQGASDRDGNGGETAAKRAAKPPKTAYVALGSNMGDRIGMIEQACNALTSRGITVKRTSNLWETEPMYVLDQDNFINGACEVSKKHFWGFLPFQLRHVAWMTIYMRTYN